MIKITIKTNNAAFHDDQGNPDNYYRNVEAASILRKLSDKLEIYAQSKLNVSEITLMDVNGNSVGKCEFIEDEK